MKKQRRKSSLKSRENYGFLFIAPFFITFLIFSAIPIVMSFGISFTKWNNYTDMVFVGLENYKRIFENGMIFRALYNTLIIMVLSLPVGIILSLGLAFILQRKLFRGTQFFRTVYFLPYITTPVAVGFLFSLLFNYQIGFVNTVLKNFNLIEENIYWLSKPVYIVLIVSFLVVWKTFGYNMILFYAGLQTIPSNLYEAAKIDGASEFQQFIRITIPLIKPITYFVVITSIIWGLQIFEEPAMLLVGADSSASIANTLGGPDKCVYTLVSYIYEEGFVLFRSGMASAVAYIMVIIITFFSGICSIFMNRGNKE